MHPVVVDHERLVYVQLAPVVGSHLEGGGSAVGWREAAGDLASKVLVEVMPIDRGRKCRIATDRRDTRSPRGRSEGGEVW